MRQFFMLHSSKGKLIARPGKYNTIFGYRQEEVSAWILINFRFCVYFYVMIIQFYSYQL